MLLRTWSVALSPNVMLSADDGSGGGGSSTLVSEEEHKRKVEDAVMSRLRSADRQLTEKDGQIGDLGKQINDLKKLVDELQSSSTPADPNDLPAQIAVLERKYERQIAELQGQLDQAARTTELERQNRLTAERDTLLADALQSVGCHDILMGRRFFLPQIEWDEIEDTWAYRMKSGDIVSIEHGVKSEIPDYLKQSTMRSGGSGSQGGNVRLKQKKDELKAAEAEMADAKAKAMANRADPASMSRFSAAKRKVAALRQELAGAN